MENTINWVGISNKLLRKIIVSVLGSGLVFSGLLFVLGYLSIKAHRNFLGIPFEIIKANDMEGYIVEGVEVLLFVIIDCSILLIVSLVIGRLFNYLLNLSVLKRIYNRLNVFGDNVRYTNEILLLIIVLMALSLYLFVFDFGRKDILFDGGQRLLLPFGLSGSDIERGLFFLLEGLVMLSAYTYYRTRSALLKISMYSLRSPVNICLFIILLQCFLIPVNYGRLIKNSEYYGVEIIGQDEKSTLNQLYLLGLENENRILLYNRTRRTIEYLPLENEHVILKKRGELYEK